LTVLLQEFGRAERLGNVANGMKDLYAMPFLFGLFVQEPVYKFLQEENPQTT